MTENMGGRAYWETRALHFTKGAISALAALAVLLAASHPASAGDPYKRQDFSLRLPAALNWFSDSADVAALGGACAASVSPSSLNPASSAWQEPPGRLHIGFTPQYSLIKFSEGNKVHIAGESAVFDAGPVGTFRLNLSQARNNEHPTRQALRFSLDMDRFELLWGKRVSPKSTIGAGARFFDMATRFSMGGTRVGKSNSEGYGFRLGSLRQVAPKVLVGGVAEYEFSPTRSTSLVPGIGRLRVTDTTHFFSFRPGVSYEYSEGSRAMLDYQFGSFYNHRGHLNGSSSLWRMKCS